ncbi:uncharacterized protein LOC126784465 [Argentina anserina]|uniref:uncharacterized protein LOC126784465 n=1 Tax=Argentina anserina TaxID=57926 RepID=UPI0021763B0A|nr:uncharacterized protein LOC126784465 [Potentilla anserina]
MKRKDLEQVFDDMSSTKSRRLDANLIGNPSSAFQVFDQRPLKRKEFEEAFDDMASHFSKSRRLDAAIHPTTADGRSNGIEPLEQRLAPEQALAVASEMQQGGLPMEPVALSEDTDKALVLYNPATPASTLYRTPASTDFSIVVNSDLIPGLRDRIFAQGKWAKPADAERSSGEDSNGCLAIVPWVESNWPASPRTQTQVAGVSEPMEAEEVEMMDTDDISSDASKPSELGPMMDRSFELQRWQQQLHCMQPQPLNNSPVAAALNFFSR